LESACKRVRDRNKAQRERETRWIRAPKRRKEKKMPEETPATRKIIGVQFTASCPRSFARKKRKKRENARARVYA